DLLAQIPGQKAEPLACLDGRPYQYQPSDAIGEQCLNGTGDCQISLAGASRTHTEGQVTGTDVREVIALMRAARADAAAQPTHRMILVVARDPRRFEPSRRQSGKRPSGGGLAERLLARSLMERKVHVLGSHRLLRRLRKKLAQRLLSRRRSLADDAEIV